MRYLYLDNLRALLMILGFVLHTCAAFSVSQSWIISYTEPLPWADVMNQSIHIFRMPLFFMISGFFAFLLLQKQAPVHFFKIKVLRIGLPFISVLVLFNIPQFYALTALATNGPVSADVPNHNVVAHLWFLVNLLVYFGLYTCVHKAVRAVQATLLRLPSAAFILTVFLTMPVIYLFVLSLNKVGIPIYVDVPIISSLFQLFAYLDYFLIGVMLALLSHARMLEVLLSSKSILIFIPLLFIALVPWWWVSAVNTVTLPYIEHIQAILISIVIWLIATKLMANNTLVMRALSKASYSIYLFHHGIIIFLVFGLNQLNNANGWILNPNAAFFIVISASLIATLVFHFYVIEKSKKLRLIFNGK